MTTLYHGTPISGSREDARQFLQGRHALISFAHPDQLDVVKEVCTTFILDNGAFSIWRKGGKLNVGEYIRWVELHSQHYRFNYAFIPDIIDGKEADNDALSPEIVAAIDKEVQGMFSEFKDNPLMEKLYGIIKKAKLQSAVENISGQSNETGPN